MFIDLYEAKNPTSIQLTRQQTSFDEEALSIAEEKEHSNIDIGETVIPIDDFSEIGSYMENIDEERVSKENLEEGVVYIEPRPRISSIILGVMGCGIAILALSFLFLLKRKPEEQQDELGEVRLIDEV